MSKLYLTLDGSANINSMVESSITGYHIEEGIEDAAMSSIFAALVKFAWGKLCPNLFSIINRFQLQPYRIIFAAPKRKSGWEFNV
jgi:hypothetical protein